MADPFKPGTTAEGLAQGGVTTFRFAIPSLVAQVKMRQSSDQINA